MHPLAFVRAAKAVLEEFEVVALVDPLLRIILCASRVEMMLVKVVIEYRDGKTGSHLAVGGIDLSV